MAGIPDTLALPSLERSSPASPAASPSLGSLLSSVPSALVALICHYLSLQQLLALSTVNRRFRGVVCPARRESVAAVPASAVEADECWRYVPCVRLRWSARRWPVPDRPGIYTIAGPATLQLDGVELHFVTAAIHASSQSTTQQPQPTAMVSSSIRRYL